METKNPWGIVVRPLNLGLNLHPLPKGSRDRLPEFSRDGMITIDEHPNAFNVACGIIAVQHEDIIVKLFVQTLTRVVADWFYHLPNSVITT